MTHTFTILKISQPAYDEIKLKLKDAGYEHTFLEDGVIDMHGIAIQKKNYTFPGEGVDRHLRLYGHLPELGCCENDQPETNT